MIRLEPIDPTTVTLEELKFRTSLIIGRMAEVPQDPLPPGWVRCYICLRTNPTSAQSLARAMMEAEVRRIPPEKRVILCDDCNQIISQDMRKEGLSDP